MNKRDEYNQFQIDSRELRGKHLSFLTEFWQRGHDLKADGYCGPKTLESILENVIVGGIGGTIDTIDDTPTDPARQLWAPFHGPLAELPQNRADVYRIFGNPANGGKVDKKWRRENIRTYRKAHALPGVDPHRYVKLHRLAEPYFREALRRAALVSDYKIHTFGDFVFRLMRSKNRLSYHSFGIAMDINSDDNPPIRYNTAAEAPEPWSEEWHRIRPRGMPREFVEAIKSVGFSWAGDWSRFKDDMHFELVLEEGQSACRIIT